MKPLDLVIHGVGHVGQALLRLLADRRRLEGYGVQARVVGAIDRRGGAWRLEGLDPTALLEAKRSHGTVAAHPDGEPGLTALDCLERCRRRPASPLPPVLMECTIVDLASGGVGLQAMRAFLGCGGDAITANKGPLVLAFPELDGLARAAGSGLRYSGAVGLPIAGLGEQLDHVRIERLEGIVNGTTNYILTEMAAGRPFGEALERARAAGLTEADPTLDLSGADAANKLLILSHVLLRQAAGLADVEIEGIAGLAPRDLEAAAARGEVIKLLASAERADGGYRLRVGPRAIPRGHPLAALHHTTIGLWLKTDINGELMVSLTQSEPTPTAASMLHDLLRVAALPNRRGEQRTPARRVGAGRA